MAEVFKLGLERDMLQLQTLLDRIIPDETKGTFDFTPYRDSTTENFENTSLEFECVRCEMSPIFHGVMNVLFVNDDNISYRLFIAVSPSLNNIEYKDACGISSINPHCFIKIQSGTMTLTNLRATPDQIFPVLEENFKLSDANFKSEDIIDTVFQYL